LKIFGGSCGGFQKVPTFMRELTQKHLFIFARKFGDNEITGRIEGV
jgi:hypothetical protein